MAVALRCLTYPFISSTVKHTLRFAVLVKVLTTPLEVEAAA